MTPTWLTGIAAAAVLCGCAIAPSTPEGPASAARYRCDHGIAFTVRFGDDAAVLEAAPPVGNETLLRDAGGITPQQTVYSTTRMRAEFGLGASAREAILRMPSPPLVAHCVRE